MRIPTDRRFAVTLAALCFAGTAARAQVIEPNGMQVPVNGGNGETELNQFFAQEGENIDWVADAHATPDVFSPLCGFEATFVLNQAGSHFGVAWYNSDPNAMQPPTPAELYTIIAAGSPVGTVINSANIRTSPNYKGGLIGFALQGGQTHFSEQRFNVLCSGCTPPAPWILSITYKSTKTANAYYLAFEDGSVDANGFNNDGDFNDDVFLLSGISCSGAGVPCMTGMPGQCGDGLTDCDASGMLNCKQLTQPSPEVCDGVDNDCNGMVDDGAMCAMGLVCDRGVCVAPCGQGEFQCDSALTCESGLCVDPACATVTCPAGQICQGGTCKGACDGVVCPVAEVCRAGRCVNPCMGVTCGLGKVCQGGVCVTECSCQPCMANQSCKASSGLCIEADCAMVNCPGSMHCAAGACVDNCSGVVCPGGQECQKGQCVTGPPPDMSIATYDYSFSLGEGDGGAPVVVGRPGVGCGCAIGKGGGRHEDLPWSPLGTSAAIVLLAISFLRRLRPSRSPARP